MNQFDAGVCGNILTGGGVNVVWQGSTYLCNELDAPATPTGGAHFTSAEIFTQPGDSRAYEMLGDAGQPASAYVPSDCGGGGGLGDLMLPPGALVTNNSETPAYAAAVGANPALEFQQNGGANADTFVCRSNTDSGQSGLCFDAYTATGSFLADLDVDEMFQTAKFNAAVRALPMCKEPLQGKIASVTDNGATALGANYTPGGKNYALVVCNGNNWTVIGK